MNQKTDYFEGREPLPPPELDPVTTPEQASQAEKVAHFCTMNKVHPDQQKKIEAAARPYILEGFKISISPGGRELFGQHFSEIDVTTKGEEAERVIGLQDAPTVTIAEILGGGFVIIYPRDSKTPKPEPEPIERWKVSDEEIKAANVAAGRMIAGQYVLDNGLSNEESAQLWKSVLPHVEGGAWLTTSEDGRKLIVRSLFETRDEFSELTVWESGPDEEKAPRRGIRLNDPGKIEDCTFTPGNPGTLDEVQAFDREWNIQGRHRVTLEIPQIDTTPDEVDLNGELYQKPGASFDCHGLTAEECAKLMHMQTREPDRFDSPCTFDPVKIAETIAPDITDRILDLLRERGFSPQARNFHGSTFAGEYAERTPVQQTVDMIDNIVALNENVGEKARQHVAKLLKLAANRLI